MLDLLVVNVSQGVGYIVLVCGLTSETADTKINSAKQYLSIIAFTNGVQACE